MADNGSAQSQDTKMWPLPSFHFKVTLGSVGEISFSEVSGLETEFEEITYRAGDSNDFTKLKMPGLKKAQRRRCVPVESRSRKLPQSGSNIRIHT